MKCKMEIKDWYCTRDSGHEGPCAMQHNLEPIRTIKHVGKTMKTYQILIHHVDLGYSLLDQRHAESYKQMIDDCKETMVFNLFDSLRFSQYFKPGSHLIQFSVRQIGPDAETLSWTEKYEVKQD